MDTKIAPPHFVVMKPLRAPDLWQAGRQVRGQRESRSTHPRALPETDRQDHPSRLLSQPPHGRTVSIARTDSTSMESAAPEKKTAGWHRAVQQPFQDGGCHRRLAPSLVRHVRCRDVAGRCFDQGREHASGTSECAGAELRYAAWNCGRSAVCIELRIRSMLERNC